MGRSWYEMGKLAQKPTTFSDFVTVAQFLVDRGLDDVGSTLRTRWIGRAGF